MQVALALEGLSYFQSIKDPDDTCQGDLHACSEPAGRLGVFLDPQTLKKNPLRTLKYFCVEYLKISISSL